jgi:hypothetical protein
MSSIEETQKCPECRKVLVAVGDDRRFLECLCGYKFDTYLSRAVSTKESGSPEDVQLASEFEFENKYAEQVFRSDSGEPEFLVYDSTSDRFEFVTELNAGGRTIRPLSYSKNEMKCVWLPDGAEDYGNLRGLREKIRTWALAEYDPMGNTEEFDLFLSHALLSWIPEIRKTSVETFYPIFRVMGPSESGKKRYLTIAKHIYRRPFYALKSNRIPSIFRGLGRWSGSTLVLDEADSKGDYDSDLMQFLNSRADGIPIPRFDADRKSEEFIHSEGYSVIANRFPFRDTGVETRCITQKAVPTDRPDRYDLIPPPDWIAEGRSIMRKLLMFRLRNRTKQFSIPSNLQIENVGPRVRLTLSLLHALKDQDPAIVDDYQAVGQRIETKLREARASSDEGMVLNFVYESLDIETDSHRISNIEYDESVPFLTVKRRSEGDEGELLQPLTAGYVAEHLRTLSAKDVNMIWRGLGQSIKQRTRFSQVLSYEGKERVVSSTYRGVLQLADSRRLALEFKRFVPDNTVALVALVAGIGTRQAILEKVSHG